MVGSKIYLLAAALLIAPALHAGQAAPVPPPTPAAPTDPILTASENLIGRALILRGFHAANNLAYDPAGQLEGTSKSTDWTLAGVNILKATHPTPVQIELEGVRVAIRYNPDAHEFQRHPLNDEKMKFLIQLAPNPTPRELEKTFAAIFSIGIDPALQRSMPPFWRHYFDPSLPWGAASPAGQASPDPLAAQTIYPIPPLPAVPNQPSDITPPILAHQTGAQFTDAARHDKVVGAVQLRIVVDPKGLPQRIAITRPLGYGLDARAAEAVSEWRFNPALHAGQPIASAIVINIDFQNAPPQR